MLLYLTIFLASCTGLIGILLKTREEKKGSSLHRLTKGGWILISCLLLLLILNITIQYQRDRIQGLQEQSAANKRKADSLLQANQRQQLQLLLQQQVQKNNIDSFHYLVESNKTDNLLSTQLQALDDQRLNNAYLRMQLNKQQEVNNTITYKLDTLWMNAIVDMQLAPQWVEKLKPLKKEHMEDFIYGNPVDPFFIKTSFLSAPPVFDLIKNMEIAFAAKNGVYYEFHLANYVDTSSVRLDWAPPVFIDFRKPPFTILEYNFNTGKLTLKIHQAQNLYYTGGFLASLNDFCDSKIASFVHLPQDSANKILASVSLRSVALYKSRMKYVSLQNFEKPANNYRHYYDGDKVYSVLTVTQTVKSDYCFFK